jgi:tyrosyl-tRNA synthetase
MGTWASLLGVTLDPALGPRDAKHALARALVTRFHGADAADAAAAEFERVFVRHDVPDDLQEAELPSDPVHLPLLISSLFGGSRSEARRLLAQGGVKLDGVALSPDEQDLPADRLDGAVLQVGKRRFRRLRRAA